MKYFAIAASCLLLIVSTCLAANEMYISDTIDITMRTGPGTSRKIVAMLKSGDKVEVITPQNDWSEVRTTDGRQGWVLTRFLTPDVPSRLALAELNAKYQALISQSASPLKENEQLRQENQTLKDALEKSQTALNEVKTAYETLKSESKDFLTLKASSEKSAAALEKQTTRVEALDRELESMKLQQNIRWFLSGAGVLLAGVILGLSTKRQRRRSGLLS
jgi:SH3 domain protein